MNVNCVVLGKSRLIVKHKDMILNNTSEYNFFIDKLRLKYIRACKNTLVNIKNNKIFDKFNEKD